MQVLPPALTDVIEALGRLPGVGPRTAERYAYYLVRHDPDHARRLAATSPASTAGRSARPPGPARPRRSTAHGCCSAGSSVLLTVTGAAFPQSGQLRARAADTLAP